MSRAKGNIGEEKASIFLENNGFEIIDRNFYSKYGEIDIIASKDNVIHFIEVKCGDSFEAVYNITPKKIKKIILTIEYYIKCNPNVEDYCIDAVIVSKDSIDFIENITI